MSLKYDLQKLVEDDDGEGIKTFLTNNPSLLNEHIAFGLTALHLAVRRENEAAVIALLAKKANPNQMSVSTVSNARGGCSRWGAGAQGPSHRTA